MKEFHINNTIGNMKTYILMKKEIKTVGYRDLYDESKNLTGKKIQKEDS